MVGKAVRTGLAALVVIGGLAGCSQTIAGVPGPVRAPVGALPAPPSLPALPSLPSAPRPRFQDLRPGTVDCPVVTIVQVGMTFQLDVRGGFPGPGDTPEQLTCVFGLGSSATDTLRVSVDGPPTADGLAALQSRFADGQQLPDLGSRAFYRTTPTGAELAVLEPGASIEFVVDSGVVGRPSVVSGDVRGKLVALAALALARI